MLKALLKPVTSILRSNLLKNRFPWYGNKWLSSIMGLSQGYGEFMKLGVW